MRLEVDVGITERLTFILMGMFTMWIFYQLAWAEEETERLREYCSSVAEEADGVLKMIEGNQ